MIEERIYRLMVQQVKDYALFVLDPQGRIMSWNAGAQRIKGYASEEIIGRHFSIFYPQAALDSGWPAEELRLATREGRFEDEGWRVRKDGSRFWASVVITALRDEDGRLLGFSKITRDLTERKLHEEALRQSEERFRLLVDGVLDYAIYMLDTEGMITSWNSGAERIKGYTREEVLGRHVSRFYPPEDVEAGKPWEELAAARKNGRSEDEGWRVRKDGTRFWVRAVLTALRDTDGHLRGFAKVTQDLTERRHLQDLEQAARNVNEFIGVLAHELRNPLAPIRAAVAALDRLPPGDPGGATLVRAIDRQSASLARIVDDMLDISRITRGTLAIERRHLDLCEPVQHALETVAPAMEAARHSLEVTLPPAAVPVHGDAHRLAQLIVNVLGNAARYTPNGGRITLTVQADGESAVLRVRDNGRGIEPEMRERIFDMFVQGRAPLKRVGEGLGIGLALARRIAQMHDGSLTVTSEGANRGSEFTLRLPLAQGAAEPAAAPKPVPPALEGPRRVLIVDDNVDAAASLGMLLDSLGHRTRVANDGSTALSVAAEFRPEIVLLDIGMPGMDGYEVARRLRELKGLPRLRIIAVTGWGQDTDRTRVREAGFDQHLVKPVDLAVLAQAMAEAKGERNGNGSTLH